MRRHVFGAILLFVLALVESSLWPALVGTRLKPELVLIASSVWAALSGTEGFFWAAGGGLMLDMLSGAPLGSNAIALMAGNAAAALLDTLPIPSRLFRCTNWVAVTTLISHIVMLVVLRLNGRPMDISLVFFSTILPLLVINPVVSMLTYLFFSPYDLRLRAGDSFASDLKY